jgi:putative CocE/NonD family hydrolase
VKVTENLARRMFDLPAPTYGYRVTADVPVPTRDGFQLLSNHYAPDTDTPAGTVLVRGPYGRGMPGSLVYGRTFASAGYHVVDQSVRGMHGSTGQFRPFVDEAADAQDTVEWLRTQPWFDGRLATLGGSYLGFTQWALQADPPPELLASVIVVGPHDLAKAIHGSGAFALETFFGWSEGTSEQDTLGPVRRLLKVLSAERRAAPALHGLPLADAGEAVLKGRAPWYREWLDHPDPTDTYWRPSSHSSALKKSKVPTLLVGGWHDVFFEQTLEQYAEMHKRGVDVALTVGPWSHFDTVRKATGQITRESLDWLGEHVSGAPGGARTSPVKVFVIGPDRWQDLPAWPPETSERSFHLDSGGRLSEGSGSGSEAFTFDSADPTPALGGRLISPRGAGPKDNKKLEGRSDVLTFTSEPLADSVEIIGVPVVDLAVSVDNPHADVFVRLCDIDERGASKNFADGFLRLDPRVPAGEIHQLAVSLDACARVLPAGHRLRLQLSGGAHPRFARNLGSDEPLATGTTLATSTHTIHLATSAVRIPISQ